jgi:hypothetical protein
LVEPVKLLLILACGFILFSLPVSAREVRGTLLNDDDPYLIRSDDGAVYKAEWYWGSILFYEGDQVILTNNYGQAKMIDDDQDEVADVSVEEIAAPPRLHYELPELSPSTGPSPKATPSPPIGNWSTPARTPTPAPVPTPFDSKWPDGRILLHPKHFVLTGVVNVKPNDTLKLRAGVGTRFNVVAAIPSDATGISAFDKDAVWDGDTWWYPVEWHGLRGYVSGSYLPHDQ